MHPRPVPPLRVCLLSGGDSRRMGTDKALLPHPEGGTWLERTLLLLGHLGAPITLLSRHPEHGALAQRLAERTDLSIDVVLEPPPWEGPLLALGRLMALHPGERLLLAPVDMPWLEVESLYQLIEAAVQPETIHLAHDGERLQPLLGLYPATAGLRTSAATFTGRGGRSLLRWLEQVTAVAAVALDPHQLRNANTPADCPADCPDRSAPG